MDENDDKFLWLFGIVEGMFGNLSSGLIWISKFL